MIKRLHEKVLALDYDTDLHTSPDSSLLSSSLDRFASVKEAQQYIRNPDNRIVTLSGTQFQVTP